MQYGYVRHHNHLIWLGSDGKSGWWCKVSARVVLYEPDDREARGPFPTSRATVEAAERLIAAQKAPR
jgi:hypothetical protein